MRDEIVDLYRVHIKSTMAPTYELFIDVSRGSIRGCNYLLRDFVWVPKWAVYHATSAISLGTNMINGTLQVKLFAQTNAWCDIF